MPCRLISRVSNIRFQCEKPNDPMQQIILTRVKPSQPEFPIIRNRGIQGVYLSNKPLSGMVKSPCKLSLCRRKYHEISTSGAGSSIHMGLLQREQQYKPRLDSKLQNFKPLNYPFTGIYPAIAAKKTSHV